MRCPFWCVVLSRLFLFFVSLSIVRVYFHPSNFYVYPKESPLAPAPARCPSPSVESGQSAANPEQAMIERKLQEAAEKAANRPTKELSRELLPSSTQYKVSWRVFRSLHTHRSPSEASYTKNHAHFH